MMSFWVVPASAARSTPFSSATVDVEREQPGGRGVDRHRGVHLVERDAVEERVHVALVGDRDADLADLAAGELGVGVVAGLRGQVEGDREPGLALGEVLAVELVRAPGVGVARVGAHHPGAVPLGQAVLAHGSNGKCLGKQATPRDRPLRPGLRGVLAIPSSLTATLTPRMRTKLTALIVTAAALAAGAVAHAAPIPVASYTFQGQDDVNAFQKVGTTGCKRNWVKNQALGLAVGKTGNSCTYRSSVVGDSSAQYSDQGMVATATVGGGSRRPRQKSFVGVGVRCSSIGELRAARPAEQAQVAVLPRSEGRGRAQARVRPAAASSSRSARSPTRSRCAPSRSAEQRQRDRFGQRQRRRLAHRLGRRSARRAADGPRPQAPRAAPAPAIMGVFDNVTVQVPNPF